MARLKKKTYLWHADDVNYDNYKDILYLLLFRSQHQRVGGEGEEAKTSSLCCCVTLLANLLLQHH